MKRMLFNATQQEEIRVAIVDGQKLIDLDIETTGKEQRKGNIYKGIITRIEPSLEAAFIDYGADRHGFLPFKEISRQFFADGVDASRATIKEACREGQELIVQVDKDERGTKGAALTTYISLAGRYVVLMPNNPRGGGVSRRVEGEDRNELRDTINQLDVPQGMSIIARTAGIGRSVEELGWDLSYLLQLWTAIENASRLQGGAFLIYQESSLVIRAIRDYFQPDIGELLVDNEAIFEQARQFMGHVMPGNVTRVKLYNDDVPLFSRFQIEHQIETAYSRQVQLPSGGSVVIDHTEALVSVDVNSARATKGFDIEATALNTNLEAADEIARQLRLRDLGGLVVIDFIDMESAKNQRDVENRLRDALHYDRARVQMGKISHFGLMELSRQRLQTSLGETSHVACPRCHGVGHIRSIESSALHILRIMQEEAMKENTAAVHAQVPIEVATYLLNEKRSEFHAIEARLKVTVVLIPNLHLETPNYTVTRLKHDELNQRDALPASYTMVDAPVQDKVQTPSMATEKPSRPEAAVRGITPEQPAPIPVEQPVKAPVAVAAPVAAPGLFQKFFSWLSGSPAPAAPAAAAAEPARPRGDARRGGRDGDRERRPRDGRAGGARRTEGEAGTGEQRRGRDGQRSRTGAPNAASLEREDGARPMGNSANDSNGTNGTGNRQPRPPREPRAAGEGREPRAPGEVREPRPPREPREPREPRAAGETREPRPPRDPRAPREARVPREGDLEPTSAILADDQPGGEPGTNAEGAASEGGRGRRRRGRGGRGGERGERGDRPRDDAAGATDADGNRAVVSVAASSDDTYAPADDNDKWWPTSAPAQREQEATHRTRDAAQTEESARAPEPTRPVQFVRPGAYTRPTETARPVESVRPVEAVAPQPQPQQLDEPVTQVLASFAPPPPPPVVAQPEPVAFHEPAPMAAPAPALAPAPEVAPAPASVTAPKAFVAQVIPEPIQLPPDLVLIETRHAAPVASAPDPEQPRRGRPRPQVVIPVEAGFQQVETRDK